MHAYYQTSLPLLQDNPTSLLPGDDDLHSLQDIELLAVNVLAVYYALPNICVVN